MYRPLRLCFYKQTFQCSFYVLYYHITYCIFITVTIKTLKTLLKSLTCHCWLSAELHLLTNTNNSPERRDTQHCFQNIHFGLYLRLI